MTSARAARLLRTGSGAVMAISPRSGLRALGHPDGPGARTVVRLLGTRHLVQALLERHGSRRARRAGAVVDVLHATTALAYAGWSEPGRRAGLRSATLSLVLAGLELDGPAG